MADPQTFEDLLGEIEKQADQIVDDLIDKANWVADKLDDQANSLISKLGGLWPGESEIEKAIHKWNTEIQPELQKQINRITTEVANALGQLAGEPLTLITYSEQMVAAKSTLYTSNTLRQDITNLGNTWSGPAYSSYATVAGEQADAILALADALQTGGELTSNAANRILQLWLDLYQHFYSFQSDALKVIAELADAGKLLLAEAGPIIDAIALIWSKVNDIALTLGEFFKDQITDASLGWQKLDAGSDGLPDNQWPVIAESSSDTMNDPANWPGEKGELIATDLGARGLAGLRQPDRHSCGAACLVAARMLLDPALATSLRRLGWSREVLATHRRVTGLVAADGTLQPPWPRALGTPPWALAREVSTYAAPHRTPYAVRLARLRPGSVLPAVHAAVAAGHPVPLYIGDRWLARHVVLAVDHTGRDLTVYEPARGTVVTVADDRVSGSRLQLAGWDVAWFAVLPR